MKNRNARNGMQKLFQYDGDFYSYTGKLFDLLLVSFFWLIGSIPVITFGASCAALHAAVSKSVRRDEGTITGVFWRAYRQNLKGGIALTLIYGVIGFILLLNIGILHAKMKGLAGLFLIVLYMITLIFLVMCACYGFPALSKFEMPAGWFLKLSGYMTIRHLPISVLLFVMTAAAYLGIFAFPAAVLIVPGILALTASAMTEPLLEKHMPQESGQECGTEER